MLNATYWKEWHSTQWLERAEEYDVFDRQIVAQAVASMSPAGLAAAQREAAQRHMSVEDVVLEANLQMVQEQLYALRRPSPSLTVIQGGRA